MIDDSKSDPHVDELLAELVDLCKASDAAWANPELSERAMLGRLRIIAKEMVDKTRELRLYCIEIGCWEEED